jgi:hypothetical protein
MEWSLALRWQRDTDEEDAETAMRGYVKRWLSEKGYGFITSDEGGSDIFRPYHVFQKFAAWHSAARVRHGRV